MDTLKTFEKLKASGLSEEASRALVESINAKHSQGQRSLASWAFFGLACVLLGVLLTMLATHWSYAACNLGDGIETRAAPWQPHQRY